MDTTEMFFSALQERTKRVRSLEKTLRNIEAMAVCAPIIDGSAAKEMLYEIATMASEALTTDEVIANAWKAMKINKLKGGNKL